MIRLEQACQRLRPDFDTHTVYLQKWPFFGDFHCLIHVIHLKQEISGDCLLGLRDRTIGHARPLFAGNDLALICEPLAAFCLPLLA